MGRMGIGTEDVLSTLLAILTLWAHVLYSRTPSRRGMSSSIVRTWLIGETNARDFTDDHLLLDWWPWKFRVVSWRDLVKEKLPCWAALSSL